MRPTRWPQVVLLALVGVLAGLLAFGFAYSRLPALSPTPPAALALLALAEAWGGTSARARLARRQGTRPLAPLHAARLAVLAKASTAAGCLVAGFYAGGLAWLLTRAHGLDVHHDALVSGAGVLAAAALAAVALWLEQVCRVPPDGEDRNRPDRAGQAGGGTGR